MPITKAVIGAALASLLGAPRLAAQQADASAADPNIFARPALVAHLRPRVLGDILEGALSPDGRTYAYLEANQGRSRLMLRDVATGRTRLLAQHQSHLNISWSPDSKRIAIRGADDEHSSPSGIWMLDADGTDAKLVFAESRYDFAFDYVWLRDGRIVFSHFIDSMDGTVALSVVDPATGRSGLLSNERIMMRHLRISPDGSQLAFLGRCLGDSDWGIRILTLADSTRPSRSRCLAAVGATSAPLWAPDAQTLYVLAAEGTGGRQPVAVNIATGRKTPIDITGIKGDITGISISADGQLMLSAKTATKRIGTVPASGGVPIVLQSDTSLIVAAPVWSNDGAFVGAIGGKSDWLSGRGRGVFSIAVNAPDSLRGILVQRAYTPDSLSLFAVSPDGHCAVQSSRSYDANVFLEPVSGGGPTFPQEVDSYGDMIVSGGDNAAHATLWSPDGRFIVKQAWGTLYRADRDPTPGTCRTRGEPRRVKLQNFQGQPTGWTISPDGQWLAFGRVPTTVNGAGLFVVDSHGGIVRQLRSLPSDNSFGGPQWSADGGALYFAEADSARVYRVLRLSLATGTIDTITRGPVNAVHPRLSPDGRTLALTLAESDVRLYQLSPSRTARPTVVANVPVRAPDPPAKPDSALLDLVVRMAKHATTLEHLWPSYWSRTQSYALVGPKGQGVLFVGERPVFVGFQKLPSVPELAAPLGVFWKPGRVESPDALRVPFVLTDSAPGTGASSAARAQWRERALLDLFYGTPDRPEYFSFEKRWDFRLDLPAPDKVVFGSCMNGSPDGCVAVQQLEQRVLNSALTAPNGRLKGLVRSYVAVRWIRRATGSDRMTTFAGVSPYLARRAAAYVAESDTAGYVRAITEANAAPALAKEERWIREHRELGNGSTAVLALLDRLGVRWQTPVQQREEPFHVLMRVVAFDSAQALAIAKRAHVQFNLSELLTRAAQPQPAAGSAPAGRESPNYAQAYYYMRLAQGISNDSLPLLIMPPYKAHGALDTNKTHITFVAGAGDTVSNGKGLVMLPDPESFVIETSAYRVEVNHVPVVIDPTPGNMPGLVVHLYLPDSVIQQLRVSPPADPRQPPRSATAQHFHGAKFDILIKPEAYLDRVNFSPPIIMLSQPTASPVRR